MLCDNFNDENVHKHSAFLTYKNMQLTFKFCVCKKFSVAVCKQLYIKTAGGGKIEFVFRE